MRIIRLVVYSVYLLIIRIKGIKQWIIRKTKGDKEAWIYGQKVLYKSSKGTIKIVGMDIKVLGKENLIDETCVFMGNHQGLLDIPTLRYGADRNIDFIAKKELLKIPSIGFWLTHLKCVLIDRDNPRQGMRAISEAIDNIKDGYTMAIFPEGTRTKDGEVHKFKKGSMRIPIKSGAPIVPFAISGSSVAIETLNKLKKRQVYIFFGKPIYTNNLTREEQNDITEIVEEEVSRLYKKLREINKNEKKNI